MIFLILLYPLSGEATNKACARSNMFQEGRCYQACIDESGTPGRLNKKGECFCYSPMPLEYMDAKKYLAKLKPSLEGTGEIYELKELDYGF